MDCSVLSATSPTEGADARAKEAARGVRVYSQPLGCATTALLEIIDVTAPIAQAIRESGVQEGLAHVQSLHTTTAVFVNECQEALLQDFQALLQTLVENRNGWRHNDPRYSDCDRGNAAAHLRGLLLGHSVTLQVHDGKPRLGKWQAVLFAELDGPQSRTLWVQVMGI
jgi:secondary thiamine-phosphate synthase enzyme